MYLILNAEKICATGLTPTLKLRSLSAPKIVNLAETHV